MACDLSEGRARGVCEWEEEEEVLPVVVATTISPCFRLLLSVALSSLSNPSLPSLFLDAQRTALLLGTPGLDLIALSQREKERESEESQR